MNDAILSSLEILVAVELELPNSLRCIANSTTSNQYKFVTFVFVDTALHFDKNLSRRLSCCLHYRLQYRLMN